MVIDTSSSFIWVQEPGCYPCHTSENSFQVGQSATYVNLGTSVVVAYDSPDTNVTGLLGADLISIGDDIQFTVDNQTFVVASQDFGFDEVSADGVIGFAMSSLSLNIPTLMQNLKTQEKIQNAVFSLYLNDNEYNNDIHPEPKSILVLGGFSTEYALNTDSTISTIQLVNPSRGYWEVPFKSILMGTVALDKTSATTIFDSACGYISAPAADAEILREWFYSKYSSYCNLDSQGFIKCVCSDLRVFPSMTFILGLGVEFTLPPSAYFLKDGDKCLLLVNSDDALPNTWRLGGPFLRKWYTIYDMDSMVMSFYPAKISHDSSRDPDESTKWIIVFFVVLLIVISIVMSVFLYMFCCRHKLNFDETYKPLFTAKYTLPPHYHRTAVRSASTGQIVPDLMPTSRQNRVFPGISSK